MITFILILFWQPLLGECDSYAVTHRLSEMICTSYNNKNFGKVSPDASSSSKGCAVAIKSGNSWEYKPCRSGSAIPRPDTDASNYSSSEDTQPGKEPKIQTGQEADPNSYPFLVYITGPNRTQEFHGIIYNAYTIITPPALERLNKAWGTDEWMDRARVQIGKHNISKRENFEQLRFICDLSHHPNHPPEASYFSLIHLYDPITFNEFVGPASLYHQIGSETISNDCIVSGWGKLKPTQTTDVLYEAQVSVTSNCVNQTNYLCTPSTGPNVYCYGDVGGPLVCSSNGKTYVRGLNSGDLNQACTPKVPTYFWHFNKSNLMDWIESEFQKRLESCRPECLGLKSKK